MKRIVLIFLLSLSGLVLTARGKFVVERVYISTDKDCYVAGDYVGCSAFCFDVSDGARHLSDFSSIVYLELVSADGVAQKEKIALIEGRGSGLIKLSPELPSGNYYLVAYTKQNINESGFIPSGKMLSIFNVFSTERVKGSAPADEKVAPKSEDYLPNSIDLEVLVDIDNSKISLLNHTGESAMVSVSVFHDDSLSSLPEYSIVDFYNGLKHTNFGDIYSADRADYEGEVIEVLSDARGKDLLLSFVGHCSDLYVSTVDSSGHAFFYTRNIYGENDAILQVCAENPSEKSRHEIVSPFIGYYGYSIPKLSISEDMEERLILRGMGMQTVKRFGGDTLADGLFLRPSAILNNPDKKYILDDYTRFATMTEVFVEYIPEVSIRKENGSSDLSVLVEDYMGQPYYSHFSSLVLIDGVPIQNRETVLSYDQALVKEIDVYTHSYLFANHLYNGIISIKTFKENLPSFSLENNVTIANFNGALYPQSLTWSKIKDFDSYPDLRQTIYWHPSVTILPKGSFNFEFMFPKYEGAFEIVVEGITSSGEAIYYKQHIK